MSEKKFMSYGDAETIFTGYANEIKNKVDWESNGVLGAKNLLPFPYANTTKTVNGCTFTVNSDESITASSSGAISAEASFELCYALDLSEKVILTGCPSGGSTATYGIQIYTTNSTQGSWNDFGNGYTLDLTNDSITRLVIRIRSGMDLTTPITFYPMLRLATDIDDTYQPYAMTNKELTDEVAGKQATLTAGDHITISNNEISASYDAMTGATSSTAGASGLVPAPAAGQQDYVLTGGGVWVANSGGGVAQAVIGGSYNASTAYEPGDRFSYNGVRYKVIIESGTVQGQTPPNATYYEVCSVDDDIVSLNNSLTVNSWTYLNKTKGRGRIYLPSSGSTPTWSELLCFQYTSSTSFITHHILKALGDGNSDFFSNAGYEAVRSLVVVRANMLTMEQSTCTVNSSDVSDSYYLYVYYK